MNADVLINNEGSIFTFRPLTDAARAWVADNVRLESYQWLGGAFVVEHRYAADLAAGMAEAGLVVE